MPSSQLFQGRVRKGHIRGFTLIELLVVIAIIGILSSVVLAATLLGRLRAMDAAVKQTSIRFKAKWSSITRPIITMVPLR